MGARTNVAECGLRRFLHHVAQLTGDSKLAFAFHQDAFGGKDLAAHFGPCQTGCGADFVAAVRCGVAELRGAQQVHHFIGVNQNLALRFLRYDLASHLAGHVADFAFEVAHAGFTRITLNYGGKPFVRELDLRVRQTRRFHLFPAPETFSRFPAFQSRYNRKAGSLPCDPGAPPEWCGAHSR